MVIFKNLSKSKIEVWCFCNFLGYLSIPRALHSGFSDLRRSLTGLRSNSTLSTFGFLIFSLFRDAVFLFTHFHSTVKVPLGNHSVRLPLVTYPSLCSTCVTYLTPCHASDNQIILAETFSRKAEASLQVSRILNMCFCSHD